MCKGRGLYLRPQQDPSDHTLEETVGSRRKGMQPGGDMVTEAMALDQGGGPGGWIDLEGKTHSAC